MKRRIAITYFLTASALLFMGILGAPSFMHGSILFAALIISAILTGLIWATWTLDVVPRDISYGERDNHRADAAEKRKRDRLDTVLRDLSDEELHRLRQRLSDQAITDDDLYDRMVVGDDGELIQKRRNT